MCDTKYFQQALREFAENVRDCPVAGLTVRELSGIAGRAEDFKRGCLCVIGCSANGECPIHGDAIQANIKHVGEMLDRVKNAPSLSQPPLGHMGID